jgi:hypothetical protein
VLSEARFNTHELPHGYFGSPADDLAKLAEVEELLAPVAEDRQKRVLGVGLAQVSELIEDWIAFRQAGAEDWYAWRDACSRPNP